MSSSNKNDATIADSGSNHHQAKTFLELKELNEAIGAISDMVNTYRRKTEGLSTDVSCSNVAADSIPASFRFLDLPAELRESVVHYHVLNELETGTLRRCIHWDYFNNPCCVWSWPSELILCDKATEAELPDLVRPEFLPPLALLNVELRNEVANVMLRSTKAITIKYRAADPVKIIPWLGKFLSSLSVDEHSGFNAVHALNFPHLHWKSDKHDHEVALMRHCPKLWKFSMTTHASRIRDCNIDGDSNPISVDSFLHRFHLRGILDCESLARVDIDGIETKGGYDFDQLQTLRDFGKWLREGFEAKGKAIEVRLHSRMGAYRGVKDEGELL